MAQIGMVMLGNLTDAVVWTWKFATSCYTTKLQTTQCRPTL